MLVWLEVSVCWMVQGVGGGGLGIREGEERGDILSQNQCTFLPPESPIAV